MTPESMPLADKIALRDRLSREIAAEERAATEERYRQTVRTLGIRMEEVYVPKGIEILFLCRDSALARDVLEKITPRPKFIFWNKGVHRIDDFFSMPVGNEELTQTLCDLEAIRAVEQERAKGGVK